MSSTPSHQFRREKEPPLFSRTLSHVVGCHLAPDSKLAILASLTKMGFFFCIQSILCSLVLGANGRTGLELVKQGLERNYRVTAFVRDDKVFLEDSTLRKNHNLIIVRGSPTCQADLDGCVEGQDVVVNVIGVSTGFSCPASLCTVSEPSR